MTFHLSFAFKIIRAACCTGNPGDGMVFVSEVLDALRVRDGARSEAALQGRKNVERVKTAS